MKKNIAVIGGGAAGMMAAYAAAKSGAQVTLYEKNEKLGKKIYITGKGRCNVTNDCDVDTLIRAFEIAGYPKEVMISKFPALYNAFHYGAPPHAGMAPGVDRMVMLLTGEENIREVIAFPMNSNAQDLLMGAPNEVTEQQLREVHIKLRSQQ